MVKEDGQTPNADTYADTTDLIAFLAARNLSVTEGGESGLLYQAMDILESLVYRGYRSDPNQANTFPRARVTDAEGRIYSTTLVPAPIVRAQMWLAYYLDANPAIIGAVGPAIRKREIDVIKTTFAVRDGDSNRWSIHRLPNVMRELGPLLRAGAGAEHAHGTITRA